MAAASAAETTTVDDDAPRRREWQRISRRSLEGSSPAIARALVGRLLVHASDEGRCVGRIVETEAYAGPSDRASHARAGRTARTEVMFGPAGHAYVYLVYGMHHCLNVVCGPDGEAAAVLIRALEPMEGLVTMRERRGTRAGSDLRVAAGPARLTQAMGIDRGHGGIDVVSDEMLYLAEGEEVDVGDIAVGPRIGVEYAGEEWAARPWRFGVAGHPSLSHRFPERR